MKKLLMIAHFCSDFDNAGNNRFNYLADLLSDMYEVELVTTDFSHNKKAYRDTQVDTKRYKVTMIHEPAYQKNVSLKRILAHIGFAENVRKYLEKREEKPDVIYCAVPSLDVAQVASQYAAANKIRFVIDVQDLWPEAFQMVLNIPFLFYPMKKKADGIYQSADDAIAVSETYCERVDKVRQMQSAARSVYIGTDLNEFDKNVRENSVYREDDEIWIGYCGTLGNSYDLECMIDAIDILQKQGYQNLVFQVMGDGPLRQRFQTYAEQKRIRAHFYGRVPYPRMCGMLSACDFAVNPIKSGSAGSIINKHADYTSAGIPVINTQENQEYRRLIETFEMGFNCKNGDAADAAEKMRLLIESPELRASMGRQARICAEEKFDRAKTYFEIIDVIRGKECE